MPLSLLRRLIREGGGAIDDARERVVGSVQAKAEEFKTTATRLKSEFEDRIGGVMYRRVEGEGATAAPVSDRNRFSNLLASSQRALEEVQKGVEEKLRSVGTLSRYPTLGREVDEIRQRLAELEDRLEKMLQ